MAEMNVSAESLHRLAPICLLHMMANQLRELGVLIGLKGRPMSDVKLFRITDGGLAELEGRSMARVCFSALITAAVTGKVDVRG